MHDIGRLVESGLKFILRTPVVAIGSGDGTNERAVVHLLGELWKDLRDLHAIHRGLDGIELALDLATGFGIPGVEVAHAAAVPKKNDMLGLGLAGSGIGQELADGHAEQARAEGLQDAASVDLVIVAGHFFEGVGLGEEVGSRWRIPH